MRLLLLINGLLFSLLGTSAWAHHYIISSEFQQSEEKGMITYHVNRPLKISDFKGKPNRNTPAVALVYSGVSMKMESFTYKDTTHIKIIIRAYMDPKNSWMNNKGRNEKVLSHEQLHFDLTALAACDLKNRIDQTSFTNNWKNELHLIYYEEIESKLQRLQNRYDQDTMHGTIESAQQSYYQFIKEQIEKSNCF